ncbi:hypothetical protein MPER_00810, partial [Moniliophthora perniciosa FA553]
LAAATIMGVVYGHDIASTNDYFVELAERVIGVIISLGKPSAAIVNIFPFMRHLPSWLPGCGFQHILRQSRMWIDDMVEKPYALAIDRINSGSNTKPSFLAKYLDRSWSTGQDDSEQELMIKQVCASGYVGMTGALFSSILALILIV